MSDVRIYPVDQLTLPEEVSSALRVKEGDFLKVATLGNTVILKPTRIMPFGSPEGDAEDRRAEQDFQEGRYTTFDSLESFAEYLGLSPETLTRTGTAGSPVERLVVEALQEAHGDAAMAAERLEQAKRALESRLEEELTASASE